MLQKGQRIKIGQFFKIGQGFKGTASKRAKLQKGQVGDDKQDSTGEPH
jgi:hypothetical protein